MALAWPGPHRSRARADRGHLGGSHRRRRGDHRRLRRWRAAGTRARFILGGRCRSRSARCCWLARACGAITLALRSAGTTWSTAPGRRAGHRAAPDPQHHPLRLHGKGKDGGLIRWHDRRTLTKQRCARPGPATAVFRRMRRPAARWHWRITRYRDPPGGPMNFLAPLHWPSPAGLLIRRAGRACLSIRGRRGKAAGREQRDPAVVLVSNNPYPWITRWLPAPVRRSTPAGSGSSSSATPPSAPGGPDRAAPGRKRPGSSTRRGRRRGGGPQPAAAVRHPARRAAGPDLLAPSGRVAIGGPPPSAPAAR